MSIDPSRYGLLTNEYRWETVYSAVVDSRYARAKELDIESLFQDPTKAAPILAAIYAVLGTPKRRFEVTVSGASAVSPNAFRLFLPNVHLVIPKLNVDGRYLLTRSVSNEDDDKTVMELWGM